MADFTAPEMTEARWKKMMEAEDALDKLKDGFGLSNYAFIPTEGEAVILLGEPCFYDFNYRKTQPYEFIANYRPFRDSKAAQEYVDWLLHRSPWSVMFVEEDVTRLRERGSLIYTHFPAQFIVQGLIAWRTAHEAAHVIATWRELRKWMTEDCAFIFAHHLLFLENKVTRAQFLGGHAAVNRQMGKGATRRFVEHDFSQFPDVTVAEGCTVYTQMSSIWSAAEDLLNPSEKTTFEGVLKEWTLTKDKRRDDEDFDEYEDNFFGLLDTLPSMSIPYDQELSFPTQFYKQKAGWDGDKYVYPSDYDSFFKQLLKDNNLEDQAV